MYNKTRNCPDCNNILEYISYGSYYMANKNNSSCRSCGAIKQGKAISGANNTFYGKLGKDSSNWKGGVISHSSGYKTIYQGPNKRYKLEHRVIFEKYLGRELLLTEVVHHEDENKVNNDIENLILFNNNGDHGKWHHGNKKVEHIKGKDLK